MKYAILDQKHPDYDARSFEKRALLYCGGEDIIKNAKVFIPQGQVEHDNAYREKLSCASYTNYLAAIVDRYCSQLFSKNLTVMAVGANPDESFYSAFSSNADLCGNSLTAVLKKAVTEAMVHRSSYLGVDFPAVDVRPESLAEEEMLGSARAYVFHIPHLSLIDWETDEFGAFKWCRLKKEFSSQKSPFDNRSIVTTQFKVWMVDSDGTVRWELYETQHKHGTPLSPTREVQKVGEGVTTFKQIPIIKLELPKGLWIGNKIGTKCADHFRMQSSLFFAQNRSLYAAPVVKLGAEHVDASGDEEFNQTSENPHRGESAARGFANRGFIVLGEKDDYGFMEPTGAAYELVNQELKEMVDEIYRIVHQMAQSVSSTSSGVARSAASKVQDNEATEIVLNEYGSLVREFAKRIYACVSAARNEVVVWDPKGLNNYQVVDRDQLLKEAVAFSTIMSAFPFPTFQKTFAYEQVSRLLETETPDLEEDIKREIDQAISSGSLVLAEHPEDDAEDEDSDEDDSKE